MTARQVWADIRAVLGIRSFQVLIVQGVVGSVPWQAMAMFTVWLQLRGFSDLEASSLQALFSVGCALGGVLGGNLGRRGATGRQADGNEKIEVQGPWCHVDCWRKKQHQCLSRARGRLRLQGTAWPGGSPTTGAC